MWRAGPLLEYKVGSSKRLGLGYQWAHISNGQGLATQNPSYDARGAAVTFAGLF